MNRIWHALLSLGVVLPGVATAQDIPDDRGHRAERGGEMRRADRGRFFGPREGRQVDDAGEYVQRPRRGPDHFHQDSAPAPVPAIPAPVDREDHSRLNDRGHRHDGDERRGWSHGPDHRADRDDRRRRWQRGYADRRDDYREARRFDERRFADGWDWNRDWRRDERYDWNNYRSTNRGAYRLPRYYAPHGAGYGYRRFTTGVVLPGGLFGQDYWIDDPYDYRLPPAQGPYRWVRYYSDALLVDVRTGHVVDTVYDIFD